LCATGVDLTTFIGPEGVRETLESRIATNVALIRDVGSQAQSRISQAVFRGLTERQPAREVAKSFREAVDLPRFTRLITGQQAVLGKFVRVMAIITSSQNLARTRARVDALLEFERGMTTGRLEFVRVPAGVSEREPTAPETGWQLSTFKIVVPEPVMPE
jgi:hypothetical protein